MNSRILSKLRCPKCKGALGLRAFDVEQLPFSSPSQEKPGHRPEAGTGTIVKEGILLCEGCHVWYPVFAYVPVMLIFKTAFHEKFIKMHAAKLRDLVDYTPPRWAARPGEKATQATFTEEWNTLRDDDLSFSYTKAELKELHRKVWLKWQDTPPADVKEILDVGVGFGAEAQALQEITGAELYGVDLNFSLFNSGAAFSKNPLIHLIICSLFDLPFEEQAFDLVYCQGVLHHTYSTYEGFRSISALVKEGGQVFIWVYALEDWIALKGWFQGVLRCCLEGSVRSVLSRSPAFLRKAAVFSLALVLHPLIRRKRNRRLWKLKNTQHSLRDFFTPRYAHRHSINEVAEWFERLGFTFDYQSAATYRALFRRPISGIGGLGTKVQGSTLPQTVASCQVESKLV